MGRHQSLALARQFYREQVHAGQSHIGSLLVPLPYATRQLDCSQLQSIVIDCYAAAKSSKPWTHIVAYAEDSPQLGVLSEGDELRSGESHTFGFLHTWNLVKLLSNLPHSSAHLQLQRSQVQQSLPPHSLHHDFTMYRVEMPHAPEALRRHDIALLIRRRMLLCSAVSTSESSHRPLELPSDPSASAGEISTDWDDGCVTSHVKLGSLQELLDLSSARAVLEDFASHRWMQSLLAEDANWWSVGNILSRQGGEAVVMSARSALTKTMPCGPILAKRTLDDDWLKALRQTWLDGECQLLRYRLTHSALPLRCLPAILPPYASWVTRDTLLKQVANYADKHRRKVDGHLLDSITGRQEDDELELKLDYDQPKAYIAGDVLTVMSRCAARWRIITVCNGAALVPVAHGCDAVMRAFRLHEESKLSLIKSGSIPKNLLANKFRRCSLRYIVFASLRQKAGITEQWASTGLSPGGQLVSQAPLVPRANAGSSTIAALKYNSPSCIMSLLHDLQHATSEKHLNVERRKLLSRFAAGLGVQVQDIEDLALQSMPKAYGHLAGKESKGVINDLRMAYRDGSEQYALPSCNKMIQCNACPKVAQAQRLQVPPQTVCCRELNARLALAGRPPVGSLHTPAFYVGAMHNARRRAAPSQPAH